MHANVSSAQSFFVSGVCCAAEEATVRKQLDTLVGSDSYTFNPLTYELRLRASIHSADVVQRLAQAGFPTRSRLELEQPQPFWERHRDGVIASVAALLVVTGILMETLDVPVVVARGIFLGAIVIGGWKVGRKAWTSLRAFRFDMNVLMSVAVIGAMSIGKWSEGAAVVVLYAVSLMLESYSNARTRRAIQSLIGLSPQEACIVLNGSETAVPAKDVLPGQRVLVRPGERIPVDGIVVEGHSYVDQSAITGEATPVSRNSGEHVYAGTLNQNGALRINAVNRYEDSTLARIVHLVEQAQLKRAPIQNTVDRFAGIYTPVVLCLAVGVAFLPPLLAQGQFTEWLYRALVLLVIACPCALVISTPVAIVSALTRAARLGILIKGGRHIELLAGVQAMAFDKTGTLTLGRPILTETVQLNSIKQDRLLQIAAALEHRSEHPIAYAFVREATRNAIDFQKLMIEGFEILPGQGAKATVDGTEYFLGNHKLCEERGVCSPAVEHALERLERSGDTAVILGNANEALGIFAVRDVPRDQGNRAIAELKALGIEHLWLLSGDHDRAVQRLASETGIEHHRSGLLPHQKIEIIEQLKLQHGTVAMVGDGVNDAPALASASVGIAMGVGGTDTALETADVVLMGDDLSRLPSLVRLSRAAMTIVKQNIVIAIALKALFLGLSIAGVTTLWMAILADDGAALIVIMNSLRVLSPGKEA